MSITTIIIVARLMAYGLLIPIGFGFAAWGAIALWRLDDARGTLAITSVLASLGLLVTCVTGTIGIATTLFVDTVTLELPVDTLWPGVPAGTVFTGLEADIVSGGFTTATLELAGLSGAARAFLAMGIALEVLTVLAVLYLVLAFLGLIWHHGAKLENDTVGLV